MSNLCWSRSLRDLAATNTKFMTSVARLMGLGVATWWAKKLGILKPLSVLIQKLIQKNFFRVSWVVSRVVMDKPTGNFKQINKRYNILEKSIRKKLSDSVVSKSFWSANLLRKFGLTVSLSNLNWLPNYQGINRDYTAWNRTFWG